MSRSAPGLSKVLAVILDFSGLILNDRELTFLVVNDVLEKFGKARITLAQFRDEFELPFYKIFGKHGIPEDVAAKVAVETYHENYHKYEHLVKPVDDVVFCIEFLLRMGLKVGIVSQTPREELDYQLRKLGLYYLKPYSVAQKESAEEKPSPLPLFICMEKLGVRRDETLYVGDMFEDVLCARNARVRSVVIANEKTSYHTRIRLLEARPDYIFSELRHVIDLLIEEKIAVIA